MSQAKNQQDRTIALGHIAGVHGVQGWVKVFSHTEPREAISNYTPWLLGEIQRSIKQLEVRKQGKTVIARLEGVEDRETAEELVGQRISVGRHQLPQAGEQQYYWADLIGLEVRTAEGLAFGEVESMMSTGANDVMVVRGDRERLIPFVPDQTVVEVDLERGQITVEWDADF